MSSVYSVRVPKKLKEEIDNFGDIDWQTETREFLEKRVRKERIKRQIEEARKNKERMEVTLDVATLIREDRERIH
ncbi:MAG: type II toxin-antitoxin system VapB family antitoxin [Nitrososphaerales archaeon]